MRHNSEILHFHFTKSEHTEIDQAVLHLFVHGEAYLRKINDSNMKNANENRTFGITLSRIVRSVSQFENTLLRQEGNFRYEVPYGDGHFIRINITEMTTEWYNKPYNNHGMIIKTDGLGKKLVVIDGAESGKNYVSLFF